MATFSETSFIKKLTDLNGSQQSIQTLSLWLIHHRKHSKTSVEVWLKELKKAKTNKKLTFLYLANDVVQNCKKKGPEFARSFKDVLPEAYRHTAKYAALKNKQVEDSTKASMDRLVNIWKERGVFEPSLTATLKQILTNPSKPAASTSKDKEKEKDSDAPPPKKKKKETSLREEIQAELDQGPKKAPEAEELVKALQELENAASTDAAVREQIADLPPEVSDVSVIDKIDNKDDAESLFKKAESACQLLAEYNGRLQAELEERKQVAMMLHHFVAAQKSALVTTEEQLQEFQRKLENVASVRKELKSHIQSLPDMSLLPTVTGGLAPLPSLGDLFSIDKE